MNGTLPSSDSYGKLGSVFTVARGIVPGPLGQVAYDQCFDVAFVRFNDDGSFEDRNQLKAATDCIEAARCAPNYSGAVVVSSSTAGTTTHAGTSPPMLGMSISGSSAASS
jgi:hypothetical protein